ncbi:MAG: sigma 54-interacting transcriptional regulator [Candidatus Glassbacteria bacterium]|nr:sigma 54-interacting transcriptional regulator [Candidatus Glassbacteria bacterium]
MLNPENKIAGNVEALKFFQEQWQLFRKTTNFNFSFAPADKKYDLLGKNEVCGDSEFCRTVQADPEGLRKCRDEKRVFEIMMQTRKPLVETCHAGLIDVYLPVFINSEFIGCFCFGKFLFEPATEKGFAGIVRRTGSLRIDLQKLKKAYFTTRVISKEYIDLVAETFSPIAYKMLKMELEILGERKKVEKLTSLLFEKNSSTEIIGRSQKMRSIFEYLFKVNKSAANVLVTGESGTGKELLAKYIHSNSERKEKPFLTVNCASISDSVLESELFGHVKGAFTGAVSDRIGILETVDGGTLCLDEIGETSLGFQKTLLRVIEEQEIKPVGSDRVKKINVRFISSTNSELEELVQQGRFREDLYYRLKVFHVAIPSLRDRPEDIPLLLDHFCGKQADKHGSKELSFTRKAMETLMTYEWPGNVRELKNFVENIYFLAEGRVTASMVASFLGTGDKRRLSQSCEPDDYKSAVNGFEQRFLLQKLEKSDWNVSATAKKLGRTREWLSRKISDFKLRENLYRQRPAEPSLS